MKKMTENKTTLAQGFNRVSITGIVKENNLERTLDKNGAEVIRGTLIITTGSDQEHTFKCYAKKLTSTGKPNPSYISLEKAVEYVSMASAKQQGQDPSTATVVNIKKGELRLNTYLNPKKQVVSYPELFFSFIETGSATPEEFLATFEVEGVLQSIKPEMVNDVETGRFEVVMININYKGNAQPFSFVTTVEAGQYMSVSYVPNLTSKIWGNLISSVTTVEKVSEGFTGTKVEKFDKVNREMVVNNGDPAQRSKEEGGYDIELIKKALAEFEILKKSLLNTSGTKPASTGFSKPQAQAPAMGEAPTW